MGVHQLYTFIHKTVPRGTFPIDIRDEIRKYYSEPTTPNPPVPVIVVDLMCFVYPFCSLDRRGVICGGRFNDIFRRMDQFFADLKGLGVKLDFFCDGPNRRVVPDIWCKRKDEKYERFLKLFDAVDDGVDISVLIKCRQLPFLYVATLRRAAMNHGQIHMTVSKECDQEMVDFANKCNALAILSDDTDFLVYKGTWRYWSTADLNFNLLSTVERNRVELASFLQLKPSQMPLLATLVGNDIVNPTALRNFHCHLGSCHDKITNVAKFIRNNSDDEIINTVLAICPDKNVLKTHIQESLDMYNVNIETLETSKDANESEQLPRHTPLLNQVRNASYVKCKLDMTDLRQPELGEQVSQLKLFLMLRMSGIILHQRQMKDDNEKCKVLIKLRHDKKYAEHNYRAMFPSHINPPSIEQLLSKEPATCDELQNIKLQLFCWIASDSIDYHRMESIPKALQITVLTLYHLLEMHTLRLFEADLILQVVHDVKFSKYDPLKVDYPRKLDSRPFRVAFVFQDIYALLAKAFNLIGLTDSSDYDPPFDGVLFQNWYREWCDRQPGDKAHLHDIMEWRIYKSISFSTPGEAAS